MALSFRQKYKLRQFRWILAIGVGAGFFYALADDGWDLIPLATGITAGLIIGALVAYLELFVFASKLRRASFIHLFLLRVAIYMVFAVGVTLVLFTVSRMVRYQLGFWQAWHSSEFQYFLNNDYPLVLAFILLVTVLAVFGLQLAGKLGMEDLIGFISGKYRTPKKEQRIFMFLRLDGSEEIIKKSGDLAFHNFLNDIIYHISEVISMHHGTIVHYMEDQIVLAWTINNGSQNANCLRTFFHIYQEITNNAPHYQSLYGVIPKIHCALHSGTVIRAEIGEIKSEIAYFGDVLNTTSRILFEGIKINAHALITENLVQMLEVPTNLSAIPVKPFTPRGKAQSIQLYALQKNHDSFY